MEYTGDKLKDLPHGKGIYKFKKSFYLESYEGTFNKGEFTGNNNTIIYTDGYKYIGTTKNSLRHGQGKIYCCDKFIIDCNWTKDKPDVKISVDIPNHTYGKIKYENGYYTGDILNGVPDGTGEIVYNDETSYCGTWKKGKKEDYGKLNTSEYIFTGNFSNNMKNGKGMLVYKKKLSNRIEIIHGKWINNKICIDYDTSLHYSGGDFYLGKINNKLMKHGHGVYNLGINTIDANWKNDTIDTSAKDAIMKIPNGETCIGQFIQEGLFFYLHGKITIKYSNDDHLGRDTMTSFFDRGIQYGKYHEVYRSGISVEGSYKDGKKNGIFIITNILNEKPIIAKVSYELGNIINHTEIEYMSRKYYFGKTDNITYTGYCHYINKKGYIYNGYVKQMKRTGYGTYKKNNYIITCEWIDDKPNGRIKIIFDNGVTFIFNNGFIKTEKINGVIYYDDNLKYVGSIKNFRRDGYGIMIREKNYKMSGEWLEDNPNGQMYYYNNNEIVTTTLFKKGINVTENILCNV